MRLRLLAPLILTLAMSAAAGCRPDNPAEAPLSHSSAASEPAEQPAALPDRPANTIYRSELSRATSAGNAPYLLAQLGPEAYSPQGRFEGWIITRVWPGDPELCAPGCDLRAGDIILSVNGSKLETPERLSNALEQLDTIERLELTGIRAGEFFERSYAIVAR